jgi:TfoX/Sxy family transcriptional regulator of competence genes
MNARTGSLPYYLQDNCLTAKQLEEWWKKRALEQAQKNAEPDRETKA